MAYHEADLSRVTTVPVAGRRNKLDPSLLAAPPAADRSFAAFLAALPDVLAARDLRAVIAGVAAAARGGHGVVLLIGGHVVKVGLGPLVRTLIARGVVTHVAFNGAAAIHDFELAAYGGTSEDVESGLADGSFGMTEETGAEMNAEIEHASPYGKAPGQKNAQGKRLIGARAARAFRQRELAGELVPAAPSTPTAAPAPSTPTAPPQTTTGWGVAVAGAILLTMWWNRRADHDLPP